MAKGKDKIVVSAETPHMVLCEGKDAYYFLCHLLGFFEKGNPAFRQFRVHDFHGNEDLRSCLSDLSKADGFDTVLRSLAIVRDAETDAAAACQSVKGALRDTGLAVPETPCSWTDTGTDGYPGIRTGFVLFPGCGVEPVDGTLEDLCLEMLAAADAGNILLDADAALERHRPQLPRLHKNRLHTYFSLTDEFVALKIGEAARANAFQYDVPQIESLKSFLSEAACGDS